jgi:hypothetical protein
VAETRGVDEGMDSGKKDGGTIILVVIGGRVRPDEGRTALTLDTIEGCAEGRGGMVIGG